MDITGVRVTLIEGNATRSKMRAYASLTIDSTFVIHGLTIMEGHKGLFVVMPSRKVCDVCPMCSAPTPVADHYCGRCGEKLNEPRDRYSLDSRGYPKLFIDVAHPLNPELRELIARIVLQSYRDKLKEKGNEPGRSSPICSGGIGGVAEGSREGKYNGGDGLSSGQRICS